MQPSRKSEQKQEDTPPPTPFICCMGSAQKIVPESATAPHATAPHATAESATAPHATAPHATAPLPRYYPRHVPCDFCGQLTRGRVHKAVVQCGACRSEIASL